MQIDEKLFDAKYTKLRNYACKVWIGSDGKFNLEIGLILCTNLDVFIHDSICQPNEEINQVTIVFTSDLCVLDDWVAGSISLALCYLNCRIFCRTWLPNKQDNEKLYAWILCCLCLYFFLRNVMREGELSDFFYQLFVIFELYLKNNW